jgi:hypothetical protein
VASAALACCQASSDFLGCGVLRLWVGVFGGPAPPHFFKFFFYFLFAYPLYKKYLLFNTATVRDGEYTKAQRNFGNPRLPVTPY